MWYQQKKPMLRNIFFISIIKLFVGFSDFFFLRKLEGNFKQLFLNFLNNFKHIPSQSNYYRLIFQRVTLSSTDVSGSTLNVSKYHSDTNHTELSGKTQKEWKAQRKRFWLKYAYAGMWAHPNLSERQWLRLQIKFPTEQAF